MNYSGIPYNSRLGKTLRFFLKAIPKHAVVPVLQGPMKGYRWIAGSHTHGCWLGSYEYEKSQLFVRTVKSGQIFYDIGAHVGYYTLLASKLVGEAGLVYAFEPFPRNIKFLRSHIEINKIMNATIVEAAVSASTGYSSLLPGESSASGKLSESGSLRVETRSLDYFVYKGGNPPPDVMKIDVEGAELDVVTGAKRVLDEFHPVLFVATHSAELHSEICNELDNLGYELSPAVNGRLDEVDEILAVWRA